MTEPAPFDDAIDEIVDDLVDEAVVGAAVLAEYAHLKDCVKTDRAHTTHEGATTLLRDSMTVPEGASIIDKLRGGRSTWDEHQMNQPITHVDDDPMTLDRISVERVFEVEGVRQGNAGIVFTETTEALEDGTRRVVVERTERYTQHTPQGDLVGERYLKVSSPQGEVLARHHRRQRKATAHE